MNTHMVHRERSEGVRVEEKEGGGDGGEAGTREEHRRGHRSPVTGTRGGRTNVGVGGGGSGSRMGERTAERERETERAAAGERIRLGFGRGVRRGRTAYIRRGERGAWGGPTPGGLPSWAVSPTGPPLGRIMHRAVPVPCHGPGRRPRHGPVSRAGPARARWPPGQAGLGPGQNNGPRAGPAGRGLHGQI